MKKRTAKQFYGKQEQRMEAMAKRAFDAGDRNFGETIVNTIAQSIRAARIAGPRIRPPAPWLPNVKGKRYAGGVLVAR